MTSIIRKQGNFLRLLLSTSDQQRRALLKSVLDSQLKAIVQIVYNVLMGNRDLSQKDKKDLAKHKTIIRRFVSKDVTQQERKRLLLKYSNCIIKVVAAVRSEL